MINNVNIYTIYDSLCQNVMRILPTIYQNKTKLLEESRKFRVHLSEELSFINYTEAIWTSFLVELIKVWR